MCMGMIQRPRGETAGEGQARIQPVQRLGLDALATVGINDIQGPDLAHEVDQVVIVDEVSSGEDTVQFAPTHCVDITGAAPRKRAACYAHASQAPDKFYALQELVTRMRGLESGHPQAEGYIRHVQSPDFALPMAS